MQVAYNPRLLLTYSKITSEARMLVQDQLRIRPLW